MTQFRAREIQPRAVGRGIAVQATGGISLSTQCVLGRQPVHVQFVSGGILAEGAAAAADLLAGALVKNLAQRSASPMERRRGLR